MKEIKIKGVNEVVYEHTLKNGLKVYIWKYNLSEEINISLTVKYGSIHTHFKVDNSEYSVPNGTAHFLEHIKFNEANNVTAHDYFYKLGSYVNAYTTYDHTTYEVMCSNQVKDNLEHLLYFVLNPYFTKGLIQKEKPIIVEEAKMTLNNPYNIGYNALQNNLYIESNKRFLVTGMPEEIRKITIEDVTNVFNNYYHPKNMVLIVTGNVNPYEVEKIVNEYFSDKDFGKYHNPQIISNKEPNDVVKKHDEISTVVTKEKLLKSFKIPKKNLKVYSDLYLRVLFTIVMDINFGSTSLFKEEIITNKLVDDIYYLVNVEDDHVIITFEVSSSYPNEISNKIEEKMGHLECDEDEFVRKNRVLIASTILDYEDAVDVNNDIRASILKYNKVIDNMRDVFTKLTCEDGKKIIKLIKKYQSVEVVLKPNK